MHNLLFQIEEGTLNGVYNKIYNCRVVKPTYEINGLYSTKFMLDKRLGSVKIDNLFKEGFHYYDVTKIKNEKYYLARKDNKYYLIHENGTIINPDGILCDDNSPKRLVVTKGAGGQIIKQGVLDRLNSGEDYYGEKLDDVSINGLYDDGYIKLRIPGCQVGQYIVFKNGLLKGATTRIDWVDGDYIYILGTNSRGTLPESNQEYYILPERRETICIGGTEGVFLFNLNGTDRRDGIRLMTNNVNVIDLTVYNGILVVLTDNGFYYSKITFDGNTNIYPRDFVATYLGKALINIGNTLLLIGDKHRSQIIKDIQSTDGSLGFVVHSLELTSNIKSKYSYIFKDSVFMILTDGNRLPTVNIVNKNQSKTTTELSYTDNVFRGLFEDIEEGSEIFGNEDDKFYYLINPNSKGTTVYELDFEYKHWIIHTYHYKIYKIYDGEILGENGVYKINSYNDLGKEYMQEVNFSSGDTLNPVMPYQYLRTVFGLIHERLDVNLDVEIELGAKLTKLNKNLTNYAFDLHLDDKPSMEELVGFEEYEMYDGTIASIQTPLFRSGRYIRVKYSSEKRFCLGESLFFYTLPLNKKINELDHNN